MQKQDKHRVQFDFAPEALERLDDLVTQTGAASRAELVRRALALFEKALQAKHSGEELLFRDADGAEQRILLF